MDFVGKQPGKDTLTGNGLNTIRGHVRKSPNKIAVRTENESLTYNQLWQRSIKLANSMIGQGINKNDLIITYMPNCPQYIEIAIAAEMIGSPVTLGNYRLKGEEIAYQINDCRAALIFVHADLLPAVLKMKETIPSVRYIIVIGDNPKDDVENYEVFLERGSVTEPEIKVFPDDLHALFYTSGTTGKPKGAARTVYSDYNLAVSTCIELGLTDEDMFLAVAPMYAAATTGYMMSALMSGGALFIASTFVPEEVLRLIDAFHPTFIFMVPIMFDWVFSLPRETIVKYDLSSIRVVASCGAPMHTSIF